MRNINSVDEETRLYGHLTNGQCCLKVAQLNKMFANFLSHLLPSAAAAGAGAGAGGGHVAAGPVEVSVVGVVSLALAEVVEQLPKVVVVGRLEEV